MVLEHALSVPEHSLPRAAHRAARQRHVAAKLASAKSARRATARPSPSAARDLDFSPFIKQNTSVPAVQVDNAAEFSAADLALFARDAGDDATVLTGAGAVSGAITGAKFTVLWGTRWVNYDSEWHENGSFFVHLWSAGGPNLDSAEWSYDTNASVEGCVSGLQDGFVCSKVVFAPLARGAGGEIKEFRVDFFKAVGDTCTTVCSAITNADAEPIFASGAPDGDLALQLLVTAEYTGSKFAQYTVRFLQAPDELALVQSQAASSFAGNVNWSYGSWFGTYPNGSVADVMRRGVMSAPECEVMTAFQFGSMGWYEFTPTDEALRGVVYRARVPRLEFWTPASPRENTLGMPVPLWFVVLVLISVVAAVMVLRGKSAA